MKIGWSLSGSGFQGTVFHLGVLARLAEQSHLENVAVLSTVLWTAYASAGGVVQAL